MPKPTKAPRECAILVGLDAKENVVYQEVISIHDYYDQLHPWDDDKQLRRLKLVSLHGQLFDVRGRMFQEFEAAYQTKTGKYLGSRVKHADGTVIVDGVFAPKSRKRSI